MFFEELLLQCTISKTVPLKLEARQTIVRFRDYSRHHRRETELMQRLLIATLMALFFGLFSMPVLQAAPANGWSIGSAVKAISPLDTIYYRRRRYRRYRRRRYRRYRYW